MSDTESTFDPYCAHHGMRRSEHPEGFCLFCCICFTPLTKQECARDSNGELWDVCNTPACRQEAGVA